MTKKPYKIAGLVANGFQAEEFLEPKRAFEAAGAHVDVISLQLGEIEAYHYFQRVGTVTVDKTIAQGHPKDYDAVLIPGGAYSPTTLGGDGAVIVLHIRVGNREWAEPSRLALSRERCKD
jgi:protease I